MNYISKIRIILEDCSFWLTLTTGYVLFFSAALISVEVLVRYLYGTSFAGSDEFSGYAMAAATAGAMAYTLFQRGHIRIDILYRALGARTQATLDVVAAAMMVFCACLLAYAGAQEFIESFSHRTLSNTPWRTPLWIPQGVWLLGLLLFGLASLIIFIEAGLCLLAGDFTGATKIAGDGDELEG